MAKTWSSLKQQHDKVLDAYAKISPPTPDDEFERLRGAVFHQMKKVEDYLKGRVSGDGSMQTPEL